MCWNCGAWLTVATWSKVRLKVKSLIADAHATSAGLLARNSEVVVAPLERNVEGIARIDDHLVLLRVLALEHWKAGIEALLRLL